MDEPQNSEKNNMPDENERLVIDIDDLDPEPEKPVLVIESEDLIDIEPMQTFHLPPSPRRYDTSEPMPTPGTRTRGISASNTITGLLVGLAAGIVSWLIMEPFIEDGAYTTLLEAFVYCSLIPGVVGLLLGFALAAMKTSKLEGKQRSKSRFKRRRSWTLRWPYRRGFRTGDLQPVAEFRSPANLWNAGPRPDLSLGFGRHPYRLGPGFCP